MSTEGTGSAHAIAAYFGIRPRLAYLGLAFAFCWTYSIQRVIPNDLNGYVQIVVFAGTALCCLLFAAQARRSGSNLASHRMLVHLAPLAALASGAALVVPSPLQAEPVAIMALAFVCGLSIGWLYLLWGTFYSALDIKPAIALLFGSVMVAALVKIVVSFAGSTVPGALACTTLPLISTWCWRAAKRTPPPESPRGERFSAKTLYTLKDMALGVAVFSFALGVIRTLDLEYFSQPFLFESIAHFIEIAVCVGALALTYRRREDFDVAHMWLFVLLVIATGLVAGELVAGALGSLSFAILTAAQMFALVFLWLALSDVAHASRYPTDLVFGLGWSLYALPVAAGSLCTVAVGFSVDLPRLSLLVIYVLLLAMFLFMRERTPHHARLFADLNPPLSSDRLNRLTDQASALARKYGLSEREQEIVVLYAQGRNRAFISGKLFISENTVRDHIKNVYKKMRIHSKQELIDALERSGG